MMVLSGMNTMEQMEDNIRTMKDFHPMNDEEFYLCAETARLIQKSLTIPCTGCSYCMVQCPEHIPIPEYFALFQHGYMTTQMVYYYNLIQTNPKAGDCIRCHQCEKHCPQHIEITKYLQEISEKFDGFKGWR